MRNINRRLADFTGVLFGCLLWGMASAAVTEATAEPFDPAQIENFCSQYEQISDSAQIEAIQDKLKAGGYYQGEITGKMDEVTTDALARLCQDSGDAGPFEYLAANPIRLLDEPAEDICDHTNIDKVFEKFSQADTLRIQTQLKLGGYDPGQLDGKMGVDTDRALAQLCADFKVADDLQGSDSSAEDSAGKLVARLLEILDSPPPIELVGEECGCSRDFSALVYGFYPYLLAKGEKQTFDFSLLDRLGFHALVLDQAGEIRDPLQWRDGEVAELIHEAYKYRVKVDVTFYAADWQQWNFGVTDKAAKSIAAVANRKYQNPEASLWDKMLRWLEGRSSVSVDGVNLYFDFKANSGDSKKLVDIVNKVAEELKDTESDSALHVILGLDPRQPESSSKHFAQLKKILLGDAAPVEKVFIFLPANSEQSRKESSHSKKLLRQAVENAFHGKNRTTVLRKIIAVISPGEVDLEPMPGNDQGGSQFDDDLVYLDDNFDGVALWPLPLESAAGTAAIRMALIEHYTANDGLNYLGEMLDKFAPELCQYVCPNRLFVYIGLGLLAGILVVYALLALLNCRLRVIYQRYFLLFLAPILATPLVFVLSMICDPVWEDDVNQMLFIILLLFIVGIVWRSVRKAVRPKLP